MCHLKQIKEEKESEIKTSILADMQDTEREREREHGGGVLKEVWRREKKKKKKERKRI